MKKGHASVTTGGSGPSPRDLRSPKGFVTHVADTHLYLQAIRAFPFIISVASSNMRCVGCVWGGAIDVLYM